MKNLPTELKYIVLSRVNNISKVCYVCKDWSNIVRDEHFEDLWTQNYITEIVINVNNNPIS